jgi:hypothetical protein
MTRPLITPCIVAVGLVLGLSACTNPYDPVQRTIGGGLIGAGSGAAIGAAAAGGHGAALGAAAGGAVGAVAGLITTPSPPAYHHGRRLARPLIFGLRSPNRGDACYLILSGAIH